MLKRLNGLLERVLGLAAGPGVHRKRFQNNSCPRRWAGLYCAPLIAGWSSPVARQAHNLKVTGSNPVPATNLPAASYTLAAGFVFG